MAMAELSTEYAKGALKVANMILNSSYKNLDMMYNGVESTSIDLAALLHSHCQPFALPLTHH